LPNLNKNNKVNPKTNPLKNHLISPLTSRSTSQINIKHSIQLSLTFPKIYPTQEKDQFPNSSIQIFHLLKRSHKKIVLTPLQWIRQKHLKRLHNKQKNLQEKEVIRKTV